MLVLGILGALLGLAVVGLGQLARQYADEINTPGMPPGFEEAIGPIFNIFAVIILAFSLLYILSGIGILRTREWGRFLGIVLGIIGGLIWLLGLTGSVGAGSGTRADTTGSIGFSLLLFIVHAFVVVALAVRWKRAIACRRHPLVRLPASLATGRSAP
jgi:hypothetical protein